MENTTTTELDNIEIETPKVAKSIYLWERTTSGKVRYRYDLDDEMVVINKVKEDESKPGETFHPNPSVMRQMQDLDNRGIGYELRNNSVVITHVPERENKILNFFNELRPCFFDGCEEMREQYNKELKELESSENCPAPDKKTCAQAKILRKYRDKIDNMLKERGE